jgi:peptidoglycan/LPS O-acetylase OafA/YrhL
MNKEKVWYDEISMIRGFTIIILLLYHAGFFRRYGFLEALEFFNLFAVPLFFFISGLVLTLSYKDKLNLKTFYKRRFQYLLPTYFLWSILTISLVSNNPDNPTIYQAIADILTGNSLEYGFYLSFFNYI